MQTAVKAKDPKKQEAGRKGAMARRRKVEALQAQLVAAKETVFHSSEAANNEKHSEPVPPKVYTQGSDGPGWGVGIGLAVAVGVVLFAMKRAAGMKRVSSSEGAKPSVQLAAAPVQFAGGSRPMFDME